MKRSASARFMPNAYVFAGGALDAEDAAPETSALSRNLDDEAASARLGLPAQGLSFYVAAVREAFEECGLLLAYDASGELVDLRSWSAADLDRARSAVGSGANSLARLCSAHEWHLALDRLFYFGHWVTPEGMPRRFDTRFFIAEAPAMQLASLASEEMSELIWRTPQAALDDHASGRVKLMMATHAMLSQIAGYGGVETLLEFARTPRKIEAVRPVLGREP